MPANRRCTHRGVCFLSQLFRMFVGGGGGVEARKYTLHLSSTPQVFFLFVVASYEIASNNSGMELAN